jgi:hypothetical protein
MKKIPDEILAELEKTMNALGGFGEVELRITFHDGKARFVIASAKSIILGKTSSGAQPEG